MLLRTAAVILVSLATSMAQDPPVGFPLETSGGRWTGYEPAGQVPDRIFPQLYKRGDELMTTGPLALGVNRLTGAVNLAPRAGYQPALEHLASDGESPVFWTRPWEGDPDRPYFLRDWSTGEKVGEVELPEGRYPHYLDSHGMVALGAMSILATDPEGGSVREATFATLGVSGSNHKVAGCRDWLALSYRKNSIDRVAILHRATLELAADHLSVGDEITMEGDLLAARLLSPWSAETAMLYRLPALTPITGFPNDSPTAQGVRQLKLADGNLWILQELSTADGCVFLQFDLAALPQVRLRQRVRPPGKVLPSFGDPLAWVAAGNFMAVADGAATLWVWNRDPANDPYQPLLKIEPWEEGQEGGTAKARLVLSDPVAWPVQVGLSARSGSALQGEDFAPWSQTVTIPAGATHAMVEVPLISDTSLEENETFEIVAGTVTGALAENATAPLVIAGNGYNLEYNSPVLAGGKLRWSHIYGSNGRVLVGLATVIPPATGVAAGLVIADLETGTVIANHAGTSWAPNSWKCEFHGNLATVVAYGYFTAYRTDTGAVVAKWPLSDFGVIGLVDHTRILVRRSPGEIQLLRVSDGTVIASTPFPQDSSIALSANTGDGAPLSILTYRGDRPAGGRLCFNRLSELDRETLAATELTAWRSFNQSGGDSGTILTARGDTLVLAVERGVTAVNRHTGAFLWHLPSGISSSNGYAVGMVGNLMALRGVFSGEPDSSNFIRFIELDRGTRVDQITPQQLSPDRRVWSGDVIAYEDGWILSSRSDSFRVVKKPIRPNLTLVGPVIQENVATTLRAVPRENFTGTYPVRISEVTGLTVELTRPAALLSGLPVELELDGDGADFTVAATRSVNGSETTSLRASVPGGPRILLSGFQQVVVNSHVVTVPEGSFTTGGPVRGTRGRCVAVTDPLLAVGFPLEPLPGGTRTGVVDLYDRRTGAFRRSIEAPAGTEGKHFGHAVAMTGSKLVVGAPGEQTTGRVFVYDANSGSLIQELKLKGKAGKFGAEIKANDRWIAVSAPGPSRPVSTEAMEKEAGTVMVFDATTLKPGFTKTTKGEFLGASIGLTGDRIYVAAPGARFQKLYQVGMIRAYSLPKGKLVGTIIAREPRALGSFGSPIAAGDDVVFIGGPVDDSVDASSLQVHAASNLGFLGYHAMPGDQFSMQRVLIHNGWMIGGEDILRFYRPGNQRPVASRRIVDPGSPPTEYPGPYFYRSNIAAFGSLLYWADYRPKFMTMPDLPTAATLKSATPVDANGDGRSDELDLLFLHRGDASLPARATLRESLDGFLNFRLQADPDIPAGLDLWFEISTDLQRWIPVLQWRQDAPGWRDQAGKLLEVSSGGSVATDHRSEASRVFFRTRAAGS